MPNRTKKREGDKFTHGVYLPCGLIVSGTVIKHVTRRPAATQVKIRDKWRKSKSRDGRASGSKESIFTLREPMVKVLEELLAQGNYFSPYASHWRKLHPLFCL